MVSGSRDADLPTVLMAGPLADTEPYYDLGGYRRAVGDTRPAAALVQPKPGGRPYAFQPRGGRRCFERALEPMTLLRSPLGHRVCDQTQLQPGGRFDLADLAALVGAGPLPELHRAPGSVRTFERGLIEALGARHRRPDDADALAANRLMPTRWPRSRRRIPTSTCWRSPPTPRSTSPRGRLWDYRNRRAGPDYHGCSRPRPT